MTRAGRILALGLAVLSGASIGAAHIRLQTSGGLPLRWFTPENVGIVINDVGSEDIGGAGHLPALRNAIDAWNQVDGTEFSLLENTDPAQMARTDWPADNIHLILFDEDNSSGYFPLGSGTVALTAIWFSGSGLITDADVLFNGNSFEFTTSGEFGRFDVQDVATHELGHFAGLDHSGWAGSTMYPYVDPTVILHRSLSLDEIAGIRDSYPGGAAVGAISGEVHRDGGGTIAGAHVVAVDEDGRTAGATLAESNGTFTIEALEPGDYEVYARPLDAPVSSANLTSGHTVETDFAPASYPAPITVTAGSTTAAGILSAEPDNAVNLGQSFDKYPIRVITGRQQTINIGGAGLIVGSTLECSDPAVSVTPLLWFGSSVQARVIVPPGHAPGHVDLTVTNPFGEKSVLTGGLEITPLNPTVTAVSPSSGAKAGGTALTITGQKFNPGSRVIIGDRVYVDGAPGGCTVVDATTIELVLAETVAGAHDVVVMDPTGIEGRLDGAFTAVALPHVDSVFPPAGDLSGGTPLVLKGNEFAGDLIVRIDGVVQSSVTVEDEETVRVVTDAGSTPGAFTLEVENPGGGLANGAFAYWDQSDPQLDVVDPGVGAGAGGDSITVRGENFSADTRVFFGVDPETGLGGVEAEAVVFIDSTTLSVVTPAHGAGSVAVMVQEGDTGQATVLESSFQFSGTPGGGGCGAIAPLPGDPRIPGARELLAATWWLLLLLVLSAARALRAGRSQPSALPA